MNEPNQQNATRTISIIIFIVIIGLLTAGYFFLLRGNGQNTKTNKANTAEVNDVQQYKSVTFTHDQVNFSINYPDSWSSCRVGSEFVSEGAALVSIQSLPSTCSLGFAMDRDYHSSDVHIDITYYNQTEKSLRDWVNKRIAESEKNGFQYTVTNRDNGSILAFTVDSKHRFDSGQTYRLISLFTENGGQVYEVKTYILEKNYMRYQAILEAILNSFSA